jgi:hypothetical protein
VTEIWNGHLASNASTSFGFLGGWSGTDPAPSLSRSATP